MATLRSNEKSVSPSRIIIAGSFGMGVDEVASVLDLGGVCSDIDSLMTADTAGVVGDTYTIEIINDGNAKANIDTSLHTTLDFVIEAASGGTGGNDWSVCMFAGGGTGVGGAVRLTEDTVDKIVYIDFEDGVSDMDDLKAALDGATNVAYLSGTLGAGKIDVTDDEFAPELLTGGTAQEYASSGGTATELHFTAAATTVTQAEAALNGIAVDKIMTASGGTGVTVMQVGDVIGATALAGGTDAVALGSIKGYGYSPAKTSTGEYTITLAEQYADMESADATLQLATADDKFLQVGTYNSANRTLKFWIWDKSDGALADVAINANNRINFSLTMSNTS